MKINKLTLKDQSIFTRYLGFQREELAAFSFANIYIWRALFDIYWTCIGKSSLCVFFRDKIGCFMYLPPLEKEKHPEAIKQAFMFMDSINKNKDISRIENVPQEDLNYYRALGYLGHNKYPDYLCLRRDLDLLRGNKFKSQRASYNYFIKHYDFSVARLLPQDAADCLKLFNLWLDERKKQNTDAVYCGMLEDSRKVIQEAFANYKKLRLTGVVVRINGQIRGFTFGYPLHKDTFCVLYEITDLSVKGLAQFIFRQFCAGLKYKYINIMDDSGLENLRKVKLSYKPERLVASYIITRDA